MKKYIHIGYPKNLSTTLQRDFFSRHPQIAHLGVDIQSNIDYINDQINVACEDYLIYATDRRYRQVKSQVMDAFQQQFELAQSREDIKATGISAELLSFKFTPDHIDTEQKAHRLKEVFAADTTIIIMIRNQKSLLKSMYREAVVIGYPGSYREFIEYLYCFKDRNFALDFCYDQTIALYADLFGMDNIKVIQQEEVRDSNSGQLIYQDDTSLLEQQLCQQLALTPQKMQFNSYNTTLPEAQLIALRALNQSEPHSLGKPIFNVTNGHRLAKYFKHDLGLPLQEALNQDVLLKQKKIEASRQLAVENKAIDYYSDPLLTEKLFDIYRESNEKLKVFIPNLSPEYQL